MKRTLKVMTIDLLVFLPLIYFGLFMDVDWVRNIALGLLWFISVGGIVSGLVTSAKSDERQKAITEWQKTPAAARAYRKFSAIARVVAIFAAGYFWLGGFFLVSTLCVWANRITTKEESK